MNAIKYTVSFLVFVLLIPLGMAFAQQNNEQNQNIDNPHLPNNETGSVGNTLLDITTLESYKLHPQITKEMLEVYPGEKALTVDFGIAYDELNLIDYGIQEHIQEDHVEFLEELNITVFGKQGNVLAISLHPSQEDQLESISKKLESMYPNVDIEVSISPGLIYHDTITQSSKINKAIPNGKGGSITDSIILKQSATIKSISVSIVVTHEDHDEMYIKLTTPENKVIKLFSRERGHADGLQTFTYTSSKVPDLAKLTGKDIRGTWSLNVRDAYTGSDTGTLKSWSITFDTTPKTIANDGTNTNGDETTNENLLEQFFNLLFGDTVCNSLKDDCIPKVAGQYISYIGRDDVTEKHSSIGLGGLNTTDGIEGFVIAGHAPGHGNIGKLIAHELTNTNSAITYTKTLGEVVINNNGTTENYLRADVAFVEYPEKCKNTEGSLCYGHTAKYYPTVKPLEIYKSNGKTYTVTDSTYVSKSGAVNAMGYSSNNLLSGTVYDTSQRVLTEEGFRTYLTLSTFSAQAGDSGGPVFTPPNSDGEVEIVGIISGSVPINGINYGGYVRWSNIQNDLSLQPIS